MRPAFATFARDADRLLGRAAAAKPSVHISFTRDAVPVLSQWMPRVCRARAHANPAMGFSVLLSGVSDAVSAARAFVHVRRRTQAHRQSPQPYLSLGCHPLVGFLANCCRTCAQAPVLTQASYRGDIPAVAGPSACSGDLRLAIPSDLEAVTSDHGDVLPFRNGFPSEVFAPSGGAL